MSIRFLAPEVCSHLRSGIATPTIEQCVEELVLNSIDAGATCIAIRADIANYKIQVIDNGFGLDKNGMDIIGERYATSKCHNLKDLDNLSFFGYRGEALASISQISGVLEIVSRTKDSDKTYSKLFQNGMPSKAFESNKRRPSTGTTIIVHSIFQNLPVRRKMLSPSLDYERVRKRIQGLALIQPEVSITLRDDSTGSVSIQTHCTSSIVSTFGCLFGQEHCKLLKEVKHSNDRFIVHGFIGVEGHFTKKLQFVYVNKRIVLKTKLHRLTNLLLGRSLIAKRKVRSEGKDIQQSKDRSYSDLSSPGRLQDLYGIYVLDIDCALSEYDISLDPGKTLVEFKNWCGVLSCLEELILDFLHRENLTMKLDKPSPEFIVKKMDYSEIVSEDSQDDVIEGTCLSEEASDRIADLLKRYGKGICTSSCSNTMQGLTVRRRTVQKSSLGHSDMSDDLDAQDCAKTSNSKQTIEQEKIEHDSPRCIAKCSANIRERSPQLECNTQIKSPSSNMMETEMSSSEILTVPDSDKAIGREMLDTRSVTSSLDLQTSEVSATPSTGSQCENRINAVPDFISSCTSCNSSTIQLNGTSITDVIESNVPQLSPVTGLESEAALISLQTPGSTTANRMELIELNTDKDVMLVETANQGNKSSSKESYCTPDLKSITSTHARVSERNNAQVANKVGSPDEKYPSQYYDKEIRKEQRKTSAVLYETSKKVIKSSETNMDQSTLDIPIAVTISDINTLKQNQVDKEADKCFAASSKSSENMFLQTPVLRYVAEATTQELNCKRVAEFQNDLKNENYKITSIGSCPPVTNRTAGLLPIVTALGSFRYQKATESALKITNRCLSANNKNPLREQCSSTDKPGRQYKSSLHVFKQSVKPRCTVVEHNLQIVGNKPECTSPVLLPEEHSIPQLGNAALRKHTCSSCTIPVSRVSNQKKQNFKNIVSSKQLQDYTVSRPSSEHLKQKVDKRIQCSAEQPTDNNKCKIQHSVTFQTEGQFIQGCSNKQAVEEHLWNNISINRIDDTTRTESIHKSLSQKPNLKRLRNFTLEHENMSEKQTKKDSSSSQKKVFLTSESFLVSAQDLLHRAAAISTSHNSNIEHFEAVDENDKRRTGNISNNIWSMIEAECRKTNKTCATETDLTHATDSFHIENANWASKQKSSKLCSDKLLGESSPKGSDICLVDNQSEYFERHNMTHVENTSTSIKGDKNEPCLNTDVRAEDDVYGNKNFNTGSSTCYQTLNLSVDSVENEDECDKERQSHGNMIDIVTDTQVDAKDTTISQSMHLVGAIEQINDKNVSKLVDTPSDTTKVTTMHPLGYIEQNIDQNISKLLDTPSDTIKVTTMYPVWDIEQINDQPISKLTDTTSDTTEMTTVHPVGDVKQINDQHVPKLIDTPSDSTEVTIMNPVGDIEQINDQLISKLIDVPSNTTEVTTTYPLRDIEQINDQHTSKLVDTTYDTTEVTTVHPVGNIEQINDQHISKLIDTSSDTTTVFKYMVETDCYASVSSLQSTQSFTPNSENILFEAATPDQESRNNIQIDHDNNEDNVLETPDEMESSEVVIEKESYKMLNQVDGEWIAYYDAKKGQLVYVNRQSGNCCLRKPNEEDGKQDGDDGRKDFKDRARTSSSVSVFMRNAGQVHPHQSHNATPFLPRNKQQHSGVCNQNSGGPEELMAWPSNVVVGLVDKHLENEDQDIASKWRDSADGADVNNIGGGSFQQLLSEVTHSTMETSIFDIQCNQASAINAVRIHGLLHPYKFTKEMFQNMKVIGQVDNKFIACMVNTEGTVSPTDANLLILVDQHAAHERVRLEQLTSDAYEEEASGNESVWDDSEDHLPIIKTSSVIPPVQLTLSAEDVRLIKVFKPKLQRLGVGIRLPDDTSRAGSGNIAITHLPACMVEREVQELRRGRKPVALTMVESLIREQLDSLQDTSGACAVLPKTITKLLNSQACHGLVFSPAGVPHTLLTFLEDGGAGLVADHSTMQQVVLDYMLPVAVPSTETETDLTLYLSQLNDVIITGAIKFGDQLADHELLTLIDQLSRCDLPFQCAHGRPSLIPVVDIKLLASKLQTSEVDLHKPNLWKLKKRLCIDEG